jgi:DNA replication protein DnaC
MEVQGDWRDENGLLVCGVCGEKKEHVTTVCDMGTDIRFVVGCECACMKKAREERERAAKARREREVIEKLRKLSLMDKRLEDARFQSAVVVKQNEKAFKIARRYVDKWDEVLENNQGLLFWGAPGTGKSHIAACIANELLDKGVSVMMTSCIRLTDMILHSDEAEEDILRRMNMAKLLVLDDIGAERGTEYSLERMYSIIDSRYRSCLPLIVTTNLNLNDMAKEENVTLARIYDRVLEICYPIKVEDFEWRKQLALKRSEKMKRMLEEE